MDDPIKIIHRYKNNNERVQYHIYIFLGEIVPENIMKILRKIEDLSLYLTLTELKDDEISMMNNYYGEYWYEKFFNTHHINFTKEDIISKASRKEEIISVRGKEWYKKHIENYKERIRISSYSFESMIKNEKDRLTNKKLLSSMKTDQNDILDYTGNNFSMSRIIGKNIFGDQSKPFKIVPQEKMENWCDDNQEGGAINELSNEELLDNPEDDEDAELLEFEKEMEKDLEKFAEYEDLFTGLEENDDNLRQTTRDLKEAISNEVYDNINKKIIEFDISKDTSQFDENIKDVYKKYYVTNQYIFKDDNIKTIKNKICCGFKNNKKFGEFAYIIPSYQYIWSEYFHNNKLEKVMIGQKWVVKNDVVKLIVEPNPNLAYYENLRDNLKLLRDNIRRQGKIKREDDETNILSDYDGFYMNNELYMVDIYNELGADYLSNVEITNKGEIIRNIIDVYLKIYFFKIKGEEIISLIEFLNSSTKEDKKKIELNKLKTIHDTINNDLILESEIVRAVELSRRDNKKEYCKMFKDNYVTQSVVRAYLLDKDQKIDIFRIFENFITDNNYPFLQMQTLDGAPKFKFNTDYISRHEKKDTVIKWFENSPNGLNFRIKVIEKKNIKYMSINLSDSGRIDFKIQWKEEDESTIEDIIKIYPFIRDLIKKINKENKNHGINLQIPSDADFRYAFINTIQKFVLPEGYQINHNDLSEFSRYFFPYVALVIEPRKRQSKTKKDKDGKSKFGTYLRYKRITKYENKLKIEQRIVFFMRNYEYDDQSLANEISKEFNITDVQAMEEINSVRQRFPNIKKSRKVLKKLENIPKYKPPGIGIDIQGKSAAKYKMRIAGARDKEQLDKIIQFMNILLFLYSETYLLKKKDRQSMKEKLKKLTKIAKRRNKVEEIVNYEVSVKSIKQMAAIDKKRLSYKADEDQNQWTRNCQNSGNDKKRRPQQYLGEEDLISKGYKWVDKLGEYNYSHFEKTFKVDGKPVKLRALKLPLDDTNEKFVYYTCDPEENGQHMYIGFLNKSKNPFGEAMPCCFIKDQFVSKNEEKRNFFLKSLGLVTDTVDENKITGDQLYILQESNKVQEGRFSFLPKHLDIFMNVMMGNSHIIKNHYLSNTKSGYYFKFGVKQDEFRYLSALATVFDTDVDTIKQKMIEILKNDKNLSIFTSLNNGDIRTSFETIDNFIRFIETSTYLEHDIISDLLSQPGVLDTSGTNIIVFKRELKTIKKEFEKERVKENYYPLCNNPENIHHIYEPDRKTAIIIKEGKNFYPVIHVKKDTDKSKEVYIHKYYNYENDPKNIVRHISEFYNLNCRSEYKILIKDKTLLSLNAKETNNVLKKSNNDYRIKYQFVDSRFKCRSLITKSGFIIPVLSSGSIPDVKIINNYDKYINDYNSTLDFLNKISKQHPELMIKPTGIFYNKKKEKIVIVTGILLENNESIPVMEKSMSIDKLTKDGMIIKNRPDDDLIDFEISKGQSNYVIDKRIYTIAKYKYETEMYQLFRLHLSYYLNNIDDGLIVKNKLEKLIDEQDNKRYRKQMIKQLLYEISDKQLYKKFNELINIIKNQVGGTTNKKQSERKNTLDTMLHVVPQSKIINYPDFKVENNRIICNLLEKDKCSNHFHCHWNQSKNTCTLSLKEDLVVSFINKVSEELLQNSMKSYEILRKGNYFVSDVVDFNVFTEREGEKIVSGTSININKLMNEVFGKGIIPNIGKKRSRMDINAYNEQLNQDHPLKSIGDWYVQQIIDNNNTVFRAFANCVYWKEHKRHNKDTKNLGYYNPVQTELSNIYKSQVSEWLFENENNIKSLLKYVKYGNVSELAIKISSDVYTLTNCVIELYVLSKIYKCRINVFNEYYDPIYIFIPNKGLIFDKRKNTNYEHDLEVDISINLKFTYLVNNDIPSLIDALYPKETSK